MVWKMVKFQSGEDLVRALGLYNLRGFVCCSRAGYFERRHWETFGPLPDRRTGNHMENPSFTGPPKFLQDLIFFNIKIPIEGLPTGIFFNGGTAGPAR